MLDLAKHIVSQKTADFEPERFEDHYEEALTELINAKRQGKTISPRARPSGGNVVNLSSKIGTDRNHSNRPPLEATRWRPRNSQPLYFIRCGRRYIRLGLREGDPGTNDDISRLSAESFHRRLQEYDGPNHAFDLDGEFSIPGEAE
jgi:hypothetical protein